MTPFFRRIRKSLINQGKTSRYVKYALGEIVLVVIGILIALQINNWNEERKKEGQLLAIYERIASDLEMDITNIDSLLTNSLRAQPMFEKVINDEITLEDYQQRKFYPFILSGFPDISLLDKGYNLLSDFSEFQNTKDREFVKSIHQFYSFYRTEIDVDQNSITAIFERRDQFWTENHPWYSDYLMKKLNDDFIEFALHDPEYKNQVTRFYTVYYRIYIPHLKSYKKDALHLISEIRSNGLSIKQ